MLSPKGQYDEKRAVPFGKTPIMRYLPLPESGVSVHITKPGYHEWTGLISPTSPEVMAILVPFTEEEKKEMGWSALDKFDRITVVPARIGIRLIDKTSTEIETSDSSAKFSSDFLDIFGKELKNRFDKQIVIKKNPRLETVEFWEILETQLEGVRAEKIGFYPAPLQLDLGSGFNDALSSIDDGVLLLRAEAYYLTDGQRFGRAILPILLTAGSYVAGSQYSMPVNAQNSVFYYTAHGPSPSKELIIVQLFLMDAKTRELVWFSKVLMPDYFMREGVIETTAKKAAQQIPSDFLSQ